MAKVLCNGYEIGNPFNVEHFEMCMYNFVHPYVCVVMCFAMLVNDNVFSTVVYRKYFIYIMHTSVSSSTR